MMEDVNSYTVDCNALRKNDKIRYETDVFVVLESDFDAAQSELAALREELAKQVARTNDYCSKFTGAEQRLTAAEQRNAELVELLKEWMFGYETGTLGPGHSNMHTRTFAALKPTESGASE